MEKKNESTQLAVIIEESGLQQSKAQALLEKFAGYFEIAADWERKASALEITDVSQTAEMKMAREARLFLRQKRIDVEKTRKELKADALREGQTIDAIAKILTNLIVPIEEDLEKKEKFAELKRAAELAKLQAERTLEAQPYAEYMPAVDYGAMSADEWGKLLSGAKLQHEAAIEAERKAEAERIAKEKAEAEERERIRKENERLKAEAKAKEKEREKERKAEAARLKAEQEKAAAERAKLEAEAKKQREAAEAKLRAEQEEARRAAEKAAAEKAKLEAEIQAKQEAERKAKEKAEAEAKAEAKAKAAAEKKAKAAPDRVKLIKYAESVESLIVPDLSADAHEARIKVADAAERFAAYIKSIAESL